MVRTSHCNGDDDLRCVFQRGTPHPALVGVDRIETNTEGKYDSIQPAAKAGENGSASTPGRHRASGGPRATRRRDTCPCLPAADRNGTRGEARAEYAGDS